jgi:LDH2 family malate/lactate/ureidoglycolate dehydrogenase
VPTVSATDERALILEILRGLGVPQERADIQAHWLLEADLRGHPSHGLHRLSVIAERITERLAEPTASPVLEWMTAACLVVDGQRGLGPCVGSEVVDALIERAPATGVAVAAVHNANHLGLLAPYVERVVEHGLMGIALTTSEALVHPWGGRVGQLGTNPIAVGVPAAPEPFVFDMATGVVSMGKVIDHRNRGTALEPGWAIDAAGDPTVDAAAAVGGAIAPFGGPKGYGLGLAVELLVAALTSSALGRAVGGTLDATTVCNKGDLFLCLDPRTFGADGFIGRVTAYLDELRATPAQEGFDHVLVPGDRARAQRARRLEEGIVVADGVWDGLQALRARLASGAAA